MLALTRLEAWKLRLRSTIRRDAGHVCESDTKTHPLPQPKIGRRAPKDERKRKERIATWPELCGLASLAAQGGDHIHSA